MSWGVRVGIGGEMYRRYASTDIEGKARGARRTDRETRENTTERIAAAWIE